MYWLQLVVIVALLAAVGWLAIGGGGHMSEPMPDRPDLALPNEGLLARTDVDRVRFSVGARGYRMDEVDDVLDRLAHEIELREDRIRELEGRPPRAGASEEPEFEIESADASDGANGSTESASESEAENVSGESEGTVKATDSSESESAANEPEASGHLAAAPVQQSPENEGPAE